MRKRFSEALLGNKDNRTTVLSFKEDIPNGWPRCSTQTQNDRDTGKSGDQPKSFTEPAIFRDGMTQQKRDQGKIGQRDTLCIYGSTENANAVFTETEASNCNVIEAVRKDFVISSSV